MARRALDAVRQLGKHSAAAGMAGGAVGGAASGYAYGKEEIASGVAAGAMLGGSSALMMNAQKGYQKFAAGRKFDKVAGARSSVSDVLGGGYSNRAAGLAGRNRKTKRMNSIGSKFDSIDFSGGLKSAMYGGAGGFAYSTLPSNSAKNKGPNYDERFEYMKRVKKMQVDQNIRAHAEKYKYGKDYHKWRQELSSDSGSGWF